jgi:hypothetical protein
MRIFYSAPAILLGHLLLATALPRLHIWTHETEVIDDNSGICDASDDICPWLPQRLSQLQGTPIDEDDMNDLHHLAINNVQGGPGLAPVMFPPTPTLKKDGVATTTSPHSTMITSALLSLQPRAAMPGPMKDIPDIPRSDQLQESTGPPPGQPTHPAEQMIPCGRWGSCPKGYDWSPFFLGCYCQWNPTTTIMIPNSM